MNTCRSTFCEIKYMNGLFFFQTPGSLYDWCWFQNTGSHTVPKSPQSRLLSSVIHPYRRAHRYKFVYDVAERFFFLVNEEE